LPERAIDPAGMEDEGNMPIHELPADRRAIGIAKIEIQDSCRQVRVIGQPHRIVETRSGKHSCARVLQTRRKLETERRIVFDD